jgi:hypothetical protein
VAGIEGGGSFPGARLFAARLAVLAARPLAERSFLNGLIDPAGFTSNFICRCDPFSMQRRDPESRNSSDHPEHLQDPNQQNHEHHDIE